ncbi:hypothetical protein [Halopiger thermotolerans]
MSMAIAHFAFGAAMTTLLIAFLVPSVRYPRTVLLLGGGWAMLPDFHWVSPIAKQQLHTIHQTSLWTDLFWFHRTLDRMDPTDSKTVGATMLTLFLLATAIAEHRSYRVPDVVESTYDAYLDTESPD